jgi:predicted lipoprotein with Yx(FWY)xxD motif
MDKTIIIGSAVVVIIIIAAGAFFFLTGNNGTETYTSTTVATTAYTTVQGSATSSQPTTAASTTIAANSSSRTVVLENSATYGSYLANASGFTLYTYTSDVPGSGTSACYSSCAAIWPIFYAASISVSQGLNASDFGAITRTDGTKQTTYKGHPLYFFMSDHRSGDVNGNNFGGFKIAAK